MRGCVTIHLLIIILSEFLFHLWAASPSISVTSTLCHQHEKNALLNFSSAFSFNNFTPLSEYNGSLWIPGTDCCLWQGVTCNPSTGHVIALYLVNSADSVGIEGELPSKLNSSALSRLSFIDLSVNSLKGTIPTWLFEFPVLVNLYLPLNLFTTIGHTNDLPISPLKHFDISFNKIEGPIPSIIFKLKSLKHLDLSYNHLSFTIPFTKLLHHFPNLTLLALSDNYFDLHEVNNVNNTDHVTSSHPQFEFLGLSHCNVTKFPSVLKGQQNLSFLDLSYNNIGGEVPTFIFEIKTLTSLYLEWNYLTGVIPLSKVHPNLKKLDISGNNMSLVDDIMNNTTKTTWVTSSSHPYQFQYLGMASCNLDQFPSVLRGQRSLKILDLSNNNIYRDVPTWLLEANRNSLAYLDISSNHLGRESPPPTSYFKNLYAKNISKFRDYGIIPQSICNLSSLYHLDLSDNHFTGNLPECLVYAIGNHNLSKVQDDGIIPSSTCNLSSLAYLDLSYNHITGNLPECLVNDVGHHNLSKVRDDEIIPSSNCKSSSLSHLDLSYNHFTGNFPECLANVVGNHNLSYLNLEHNQMSGTIYPTLFKDCSRLQFLILNNNNLTGKIPLSLASCSELLSLDLGNNKLDDTFPMWLGTLPKLHILSLHSNNIYGSLLPNTGQKYLFPQLRFLDISRNNLNGTFSESFVWILRGMTPENERLVPTSLGEMDRNLVSTYGSIRAMVKGIEQHLEKKVLSSTVLLHASQNQFQGHIPEAIGSLVSLTSLNLSHNCFTGHIPSSLSNLSQLQNMDLSSNRLDGKIPDQLRELHFLEVFNVSNNNLTGAVPEGKQFDTFDDKSYLGNPRLCGEYLTNKCRKPKRSVPFIDEEENVESANPMGWLLVETVLLGLGCGIMIGLVGGYFLFLKWIPQWILRLACPLVESILDKRRKWKNKRRI